MQLYSQVEANESLAWPSLAHAMPSVGRRALLPLSSHVVAESALSALQCSDSPFVVVEQQQQLSCALCLGLRAFSADDCGS